MDSFVHGICSFCLPRSCKHRYFEKEPVFVWFFPSRFHVLFHSEVSIVFANLPIGFGLTNQFHFHRLLLPMGHCDPMGFPIASLRLGHIQSVNAGQQIYVGQLLNVSNMPVCQSGPQKFCYPVQPSLISQESFCSFETMQVQRQALYC